jgi:hypothetical protein
MPTAPSSARATGNAVPLSAARKARAPSARTRRVSVPSPDSSTSSITPSFPTKPQAAGYGTRSSPAGPNATPASMCPSSGAVRSARPKHRSSANIDSRSANTPASGENGFGADADANAEANAAAPAEEEAFPVPFIHQLVSSFPILLLFISIRYCIFII